MVNYAGHGGQQMNRGRRDRGRDCSRGGTPFHPTDDHRDPSTRLSCQICGKVGHTVVHYLHRIDESYQDEPTCAALVATSSYKIDSN